ncbi:hypothetical protein LCGC14_1554480 [marine sediment metagenome]|uniref:Uncharacterized protein n=1 Tax=marine sediment metagenome TaxID=412755 RepID=A0A0F9IPC4_9ZZZZ
MHNGRKEVLTIKQARELLGTSSFGSFTNKWDHLYTTVRRIIKKIGVLDPSLYNLILESSIKYMKAASIQEGSSTSENLMRTYMEYLFGARFEKDYPPWLSGLELDGYNIGLGIAFEFNGPDHYDVNYVRDKYGLTLEAAKEHVRKREANDRRKVELCKDNGVLLIVLESRKLEGSNRFTSFDKMQSAIEKEYAKLTGTQLAYKKPLDYKIAMLMSKNRFLRLDFFNP